MKRLVSFLWGIRYLIIFVISVLGVIIAYNFFRMATGEDINIFLFTLTLVGFGLSVSLYAIIDYLHSNSAFKSILTKDSINTLEELFKEQYEAFTEEYSKQKNYDQELVFEAEVVEKDEFEGDPVYDNLDNIYNFAKRSSVHDRDLIIDDLASLTVLELKNMCREKGINGFSRMKKTELIKALEELN